MTESCPECKRLRAELKRLYRYLDAFSSQRTSLVEAQTKARREMRPMTQRELAIRLGVSPPSLSRFFKGRASSAEDATVRPRIAGWVERTLGLALDADLAGPEMGERLKKLGLYMPQKRRRNGKQEASNQPQARE